MKAAQLIVGRLAFGPSFSMLLLKGISGKNSPLIEEQSPPPPMEGIAGKNPLLMDEQSPPQQIFMT